MEVSQQEEMDMEAMDFQALEKARDNFKPYRAVESELLWGSAHPVKDPLITVLILTYKRPGLFRKAFQSVCAQKEVGFAWEILVLDNDPQGTEALKAIAATGNRRVRYYRNKKNMGHEGSMNRGIALADGRWVALLHDDDLLVSNYLVLAAKYLKACSRWKKPLAYIRAGHLCFAEESELQGYPVYGGIEPSCFVKPELWLETLLRGCGPTYVNSCGSLVNRRAFLEVGGYDLRLNPIADATLGLIFMRRGYAVYASGRVLGFYRQGMNVSAKKETMLGLIHADFQLREYLYQTNWATWLFGVFFRGVQYQIAVDSKLGMAKRYYGKGPAGMPSDEIPSMEEIGRIHPYRKQVAPKLLLRLLQGAMGVCYRHGKAMRCSLWFLQHCANNGVPGWKKEPALQKRASKRQRDSLCPGRKKRGPRKRRIKKDKEG